MLMMSLSKEKHMQIIFILLVYQVMVSTPKNKRHILIILLKFLESWNMPYNLKKMAKLLELILSAGGGLHSEIKWAS
jgi:hypothetical protein